jgi:hypothetical protein
MKKVIFIISTLCFLVSCQQIQRDLTRNAVLEMNGNFLYLDEIKQVIPANLSVADSTEYVERYKKQWIIGNLMFEKAKENINKFLKEAKNKIFKLLNIFGTHNQNEDNEQIDEEKKIFNINKFFKIITSKKKQDKNEART